MHGKKEGKMAGRGTRGRPKMGMIDDLMQGMCIELKTKTEDWNIKMARICH